MNQKFNILYIDLLSPKGHLFLNRAFLNIFASFSNRLDLSCQKGYMECNNIPKKIKRIYGIPIQYYKVNSKFNYRIKNIKKINWVMKNINIDIYDLIFISSYETISFSLVWPRNIKPRVIVFNHNNLDEINNKFKYIFFKLIPKYIEHAVFEDYMKNYLLKEIKIPNKVWVVHHPTDISKSNDYKKIKNKFFPKEKVINKIIFAPSGSNDENFIQRIVSLQRKDNFFDSMLFKLIIKSKKIDYQENNLIIIKKYLSYEEYVSFFNNALLILLPYPKSFSYRISGVLFDCFSFRKRFVASSIPIFRYYVNKYPGIGRIYNDINEFRDVLFSYNEQLKWGYCLSPDSNFSNNTIFNKIQKDYSIQKISIEIQNILNDRDDISSVKI